MPAGARDSSTKSCGTMAGSPPRATCSCSTMYLRPIAGRADSPAPGSTRACSQAAPALPDRGRRAGAVMPGWDLERFVAAQAPIYDRVLAELRAGRKQTHWMWFVFPQIAGLGRSPMARAYAIASLEEARAYLAHPVLGARLREFTRAALASGRAASAVFASPDDL